MPIYEYQCKDCGSEYEQLRRMADADRDLRCPKCQSEHVDRMLSCFATGGCSATPGGGFT